MNAAAPQVKEPLAREQANGAAEPPEDGYNLDGFIAAIPGVSGSVSFTYRPIDYATAARFRVKKNRLLENQQLSDEDKEVGCIALDLTMALDNVSWWRVNDAAGKQLSEGKPSMGVAARFTMYQHGRLLAIVNGGAASDVNPNASASQVQQPANAGKVEDAEKN